ncbi:MAG: glycosyltransferase family 4 protein [Bacteroidetes bacterium]|nr:glycosyltransferase family 4 protein [Bacteroidota bacterium]
MKLLILTQYFPPEVGAPQNRLFELAVRLRKKGMDVTVLTAMPNYPQMEVHIEFKGKFYSYEEANDLKIHRSWIYVSKSKGILKRLINYFSFVLSSLWIGCFKLGKYDFILCESPPLFLGITAYLLKKIKGAKLIFNVSDLWPESAEKLGLVTNKFFLYSATRLEEFLYRKSELISGQTQGICRDISARFPEKKVYWLPNGVDLNYYNSDSVQSNWRKENNFSDNDILLLYAGIIGHAQGLEVIIKAADRLRSYSDIKFLILGSGPEKDKLMRLKNELKTDNVYFLDAVTKKEMPSIVAASDIALIPLKRLDLFKGAIPSKIFENLAMKKTLLLGVEGEAKELFIDQGNCGDKIAQQFWEFINLNK